MHNEDSQSCDLSSSCTDDEDEDYIDSCKAGKSPKGNKNPFSRRQRRNRASCRSPRLASSSTESENKNNPSPRRSQKEARTSPSSSSPSTATAAISRKSPLAVCSRSIRKRQLPRPSNYCGNLSDTNSSSSSDDSLLFRNAHSLTSMTKSTKKNSVVDNGEGNNNFERKGANSVDDKTYYSSPGIKLHGSDFVKYNGKITTIDNIQFFRETNANGDSSDSDDTAELVRQLTQKASSRNICAAGSSFPSQHLSGCSSSSSPKPKESPSRDHNGSASSTIRQSDQIFLDRDKIEADDEGSYNGEYNDGMGEALTRQETRLTSNPGTKPPSQSMPKEVCAYIDAKPFSNLQNVNVPNQSFDDNRSNIPVRFELPTQSSSSEESSSASGEEFSDDNVEERELRNTTNSNSATDRYSMGMGGITQDGENDDDVHREEKQQKIIPYQENHRHRQGHEVEQFTTRTERDLFEAAFDVQAHIKAGNTAVDRPEDCGLHRTSRQMQDFTTQRRRDGVTRTDEQYLGVVLEAGHQSHSISCTSQHRYQQQQPCIDLVDSDDNEHEKQNENAYKRSSPEHQNRRQEHCHSSRAEIFENEESPRSSTRKRSPKFNVTARNFIYNKPWMSTNHRCRQSEEDDVEDADSKFPARPRRVTKDHTNHIIHHNNNSGGRNMYEQSSVSNYFQQKCSSNARSYQDQRPDHQHHQQSIQTGHRQSGVGNIPRPWPSGAPPTTRRMRDPTASNVSLAASVVVKDVTRGGRRTSKLTTPSAADYSRNQTIHRLTEEHRRNDVSIGDIRTFVSRRPSLVNETRNRARAIETVRSSRYDIQGHANVTVVNHPSPPMPTGRRSRSRRLAERTEEEDVIEVFDDEEETRLVTQPARSRKAAAVKPKPKTKARGKTKRKRATTRKTKSRKTGGRKRTRKAVGSTGKGRGGGGGRFGKRGGTGGGINDDSGAWGPTGGGWASTRPVHREDPAFQNVGAEITF